MRPHRLVMRAYGAFAGEQIVDFGELQDRTLFLIHGPTGSGKTTILDAMCFALYGATSGGEREWRHIRSDYAGPSAVTEVELEFALGHTAYRIHRRPEQHCVKRAGREPVKVRHEARLWKRNSATGPAPDWELVTAKTTEVAETVEHLLGFRSDQFRQVVMLPQGQFRQLLTASSKDREKILAVLFRTELYKRVEDELRQAARAIEDRAKTGRMRLDVILEGARATQRDDLVQRLDAEKLALEELLQEMGRLRIVDQQSQDRLNEAVRVNEKLRELADAHTEVRSLEAQVADVSVARSNSELARRALTLVADEKALDARLREAEEAEVSLTKARKTLEKFRKQKEYAEERLNKEKARQEDRDGVRTELARLDALADKVKGLEQIRTELRKAGAAWLDSQRVLKNSKRKLEECEAKMKEKQQALREAEKVAERAELLQNRAKQASDHCDLRDRLEKSRAGESARNRHLARASKELAKVDQTLSKAEADYATLESAWIEGQAAALAEKLADGEPCPVCGATEHPAPATSDRQVPSDAEIKAGKQRLENLRTSRLAAIEEKGGLESALRETQAVVEVLVQQLGPLKDRSLAELQSDLDAVKRELALAAAASERIKELTREMDVLGKAMAKATAEQEEAERQGKEAESARNRLQGVLSEREAAVPEGLGTTHALGTARQEAQERLQWMEKAWEDAQQEFAGAAEKLAARQSAREAAEETRALAAERSLAQQQEFAKRLADAGFRDREQYRSVKRTKAEIDQMELRIREFDNRRSAATDRLKRAEEQAGGLEKPDIRSLQVAAKKAKEDLERALQQETSLRGSLERNAKALSDLDKAAKELAALESQFEVVGRIAEVANGKNREGISFQRYVLAALLDDVLYAASERLGIMSDGRFRLRRVRERTSGHGAGGLDLEVHDAYTGTERPVETLSGGEGFLASLALALGLADVVQSYSGGIRLDTVFVDEGFGSLDPEALDLAYRALVELQSTGRLVGIISHVPELKEQINVRLEVRPGRNGSSARFVTG
ncbi:MAG: SMC family ATPase [Thermodesulfobacteriota bacterium]